MKGARRFAWLASLGLAAVATAEPLGLAAVAAAEPLVLEIDAQASKASFELDATLHTVEGEATLLPGARIHFDPESGAASGSVRIDAKSLDTGIDARNEVMHTDVLESDRYPEIAFTARSLEVTSRDADMADFVLHGALAIHGSSHPVSLSGRATGSSPGTVAVTASVTLPYVEWGMRDVSNFVLRVSEEVHVRLVIAAKIGRDLEPAR